MSLNPRRDFQVVLSHLGMSNADIGALIDQLFPDAPVPAGKPDKVYRVVKADGTPVNTRSWSSRGHASSSNRWSYAGHAIQEGTVTWAPLPAESKESTDVQDPAQLVLPLEHGDLGRLDPA